MNTKLQVQLDKLSSQPAGTFCFAVHANEWVKRPNADFMDTDFHLPALNCTEDGYKSNTVVVLTTRSSMQGRLLNACLGYLKFSFDEDEDVNEYQNHLKWASDDGEEVIGWMPVPVFHVDENTTLQQDTSKHLGHYFEYGKPEQE